MNELQTINKLKHAQLAIHEVRELDEIKRLIDQSEALKGYAKAQQISREMQNDIAEYNLYATRQMGIISAALEKASPGVKPSELCPHNGHNSKTETLAAVGIDRRRAAEAEKLAAIPEPEFAEMITKKRNADELTKTSIMKEFKMRQKTKMRQAKEVRKNAAPDLSEDDCQIICADIRDGLPMIADSSIDFIITDPPYPKEFIPLYESLSLLANRVLKNGGSLLCMSGQSYLDEVMTALCKHMTYHWTLCYLTPGGQSPQLWTKKVNTFWKPVIWLTKGKHNGDLIGDVIKTPPNENDKRYHKWGQSLAGIDEIIQKFTYPGQSILDPFLGGGTTAICAVMGKRRFTGADVRQECVDVTRERLAEVVNEGC